MQNGVLPHFGVIIRDWLDLKFPGRWMGRCDNHDLREVDIVPRFLSCRTTFTKEDVYASPNLEQRRKWKAKVKIFHQNPNQSPPEECKLYPWYFDADGYG